MRRAGSSFFSSSRAARRRRGRWWWWWRRRKEEKKKERRKKKPAVDVTIAIVDDLFPLLLFRSHDSNLLSYRTVLAVLQETALREEKISKW